jgi:hypothetical protein
VAAFKDGRMKVKLAYWGDAPGQAKRILIDGKVYDREDPPFEVEESEASRLLSIGGFYEIKTTEADTSDAENKE